MPVACKPDNKALRDALDVPDGFLISRHRDYIEHAVRSLHRHTVVFRELVEESTCVLYALGLFREPGYRAIAGNFGRSIFAGRAFMEWLINTHLVEIAEPKPGCLALYFDGGTWKHVGIVIAPGRVVSQWGEFPVYEHEVCELPSRYGNEVRYFDIPGPGEPLRLFVAYAKTQGITDTDIANVVDA